MARGLWLGKSGKMKYY